METNIYEKNENGYILRQRNAATAVAVTVTILLGLFFPVYALAQWLENQSLSLSIWGATGIFLACVAVALAILRSEWRHMIIDEKGISFHRPLASPKLIPWEDVRDWGIAYQMTRHGWVYYLYFSTERLKAVRHGRNKKMPLTYGKAVYISVEPEDLSALRRLGLITFCMRRLAENQKGKRHPVRMFRADLADHMI